MPTLRQGRTAVAQPQRSHLLAGVVCRVDEEPVLALAFRTVESWCSDGCE
jgi:hypothetical protein